MHQPKSQPVTTRDVWITWYPLALSWLMMGIELVRDRATAEPFPASRKVSARIPQITMEHGLHVSSTSGCADWVNGDDVRFYPPLVISPEEIETAVSVLDTALDQATREFGV